MVNKSNKRHKKNQATKRVTVKYSTLYKVVSIDEELKKENRVSKGKRSQGR